MGSARVVAELVRKPNAICSGVIKIRRTMVVAAPHEAKYQPMGSEMVDGPGLDVVELDELESMNAESAGKSSEYRWVRLDDGERAAYEVVLLRLLWLLFIDLHVEQIRVVIVCTIPRASSRFLPFSCLLLCLEKVIFLSKPIVLSFFVLGGRTAVAFEFNILGLLSDISFLDGYFYSTVVFLFDTQVHLRLSLVGGEVSGPKFNHILPSLNLPKICMH